MAQIDIGEAARRTGVRTSTLRYYEEAGIIPAAPRVNGRRRYDAALLGLIELARFAQSVGFSLAEIRELFRTTRGRKSLNAQWRPLARAKIAELDRVIRRAKRMKVAIESGLACGCIRVEDCLPSRKGRHGP